MKHPIGWTRSVYASLGLIVASLGLARGCTGERAPDPAIGSSTAALSTEVWQLATPTNKPQAQASQAMAYDGSKMLMFGAATPNDAGTAPCASPDAGPDAGVPVSYPGETWQWNGSNWNQLSPATSPPDRHQSGMASAGGTKMLMFGGHDNCDYLGDTWQWDGTTWAHVCTSAPCTNNMPLPRTNAVLAFDKIRSKVVLFGGYPGGYDIGDTWEWDGASWAQLCTAPACSTNAPTPRAGHTMVYDGQHVVLFGGYSGNGWQNDLWSWDGAAWTPLCNAPPCNTNLPPARTGQVMAYDTIRHRIIVHGGQTSTAQVNTTWEFDGTKWEEIFPTNPPTPRGGATMDFDTAHGVALMFGGATIPYTAQGETWLYHARGSGCVLGTECDTGHCTDGVCCDAMTCGVCQTCNGVSPGVCGAVKSTDDDTCNGTSTCDANGACTLKNGQGCTDLAQCASKNCIDGYCCNAPCSASCDVCAASISAGTANGVCGPAKAGYVGSPLCNGFLCPGNSTTCSNSCSSDATCAPGYFCAANATCLPYRNDGIACNDAAGADCLVAGCHVCQNSHCVDGYCCDTACTNSCDACNVNPGVCSPAGDKTPGNPSCAPYLCTASSTQCGSTCNDDSQCVATSYCRTSDHTCQTDQDPGQVCSSASQCKSGFCVDGVCCGTKCDGLCQACSAALKTTGPDGVCGNAADGKDPRSSCTDQGVVSCKQDGQCDGKGACRLYTKGSSCGTTVCTAGNLVKGQICDGVGSCATDNTGVDCAPYVCSLTLNACANPCNVDTDCTAGNFCDTGTCKPKRVNGANCTGTSQCQTGFCVESVCCESLCNGVCQACAAANKTSGDDGLCGNAKVGTDPHSTCQPDSVSTCQHDGECDGNGACRLYAMGAVCGATSCVSNVQTGYACNGTGTCLGGNAVDCMNFSCTGGACKTSCTAAADCIADAWCDVSSGQGVCKPKGDSGATCASKSECKGGICVDGVCCNTACQGQCEACDAVGAVGTCTAITGTPHNMRAACPAGTTSEPCSAASCDGVSHTQCLGFVGASMSCRAGSCAEGTAKLPAVCDGKGACPLEETKNCEPFICSGTSCATMCADDKGCATGYRCDKGQCIAGGTCDGDHTVTGSNKVTVDCSPFKCDPSGSCKTTCASIEDCAAPDVCDLSGMCVAPAPASASDQGGCSCRLARESTPDKRAAGWFALLGSALLVSRRRRRREPDAMVVRPSTARRLRSLAATLGAAAILVSCSSGSHDSPSPVDEAVLLAGSHQELAPLLRRTSDGWQRDTDRFVSPGWRQAARAGTYTVGAQLPVRGDAAVEVGIGQSDRYRLRLTIEGAAPSAGAIDGGRVAYSNLFASTDAVYVADPNRIELFLVLRDARARSEFTWHIDTAPGLRDVRREPSGAIDFADEGGQTQLRIPPAFAVDAKGTRREAELSLAGSALSVHLDTQGLVFPILLDPGVEIPSWQLVDVGVPSARKFGAMAFDSGRGKTVIFGGEASSGYLIGDTWEWDGTLWKLMATTGPSPRIYQAMAYDPIRAQTVMNGGYDNANGLDDTWVWDGVAWAKKTPTTTTAGQQIGHAMVFDGKTNTILLHGTGTWEWNGSDWSHKTPVATPGDRYFPAMTYDSVAQKVVLFGGCSGFFCDAPYQNDTWSWSGTNWAPESPATVPPGRGEAAMAYDAATGKTTMFGGRSGAMATDTLADMWEWSGTNWAPKSPTTTPPGRYAHGVVYDSARSRVVLFGGSPVGTYAFGDLWEWNGITWLQPASPVSRYSPAMAPDNAGKALLFGGYTGDNASYLGDTFEWGGTTWTAKSPATSPPARSDASMVYDSKRGATVLFGGTDDVDLRNDTWEWNGATWANKTPAMNNPEKRSDAAMAFDVGRGVTVLFGGYSETGSPQDTWEWDGTTWQPKGVGGPGGRGLAGMAYDPIRSTVVLYGGYTATGSSQDMWEWNGTVWSPIAVTTPDPRYAHGMVTDSARKRIVMYGGRGGGGGGVASGIKFIDTWEWNGSAWNQITVTGPVYRGNFGMAFDPTVRKMLLFGGASTGTVGQLSETWAYYVKASGCTGDTDCDDGLHCVDTVCCDTASCGTCQTCNGTTPGTCSNVVNADDPDSCTGTCNASSVCKSKQGQTCSTGPQCVTGNCVDTVCCDTTCSGPCDVCLASLAAGTPSDGTCSPMKAGSTGTPACGANLCNGVGATCPTTCASDNQCAANYFCAANSTCQARKGQALACNDAAGADCLTAGCRVCSANHCVDGYCCDTACSGQCDVCAAALGAATNGTCGNAAAKSAGNPTCAPNLCTGSSAACGATCSTDSDCAANGWCRTSDHTCQPDQAPGASCTSTSQCSSGFCVDNVCCSTQCNGACQACSAALKDSGADGLCGNTSNGKDPHNDCSDDGASSCGQDGQCNGSGACRKYAKGAACGGTSCAGNLVKGYVCDGLGTCGLDANGSDCDPYVCSGTACVNPCINDASCTPGNFCDAGTCKAKRASGGTCAGTNECATGFCVEKICCDTACNGICQACTAANQSAGIEGGAPVDGKCGLAKAGVDPHDDCADDGSASCKRDGTCDGSGACRNYASGTACGATTCVDNVQTGNACNGTGTCLPNETVDCKAYLCAAGACDTTCASSADCATTAWCDLSSGTGICKTKGQNGDLCAGVEACTSGFCADGHCCSSACTGQCEACDVQGAEGTCAPVAGVPHTPRAACAAGTADAPCTATSCDGNERTMCAAFAGASIVCRPAGCASGVATITASCDGKGACPAPITKTCTPFVCGSTDCKTTCTADTDCASPLRCDSGKCIAGATCDGDHTVTKSDKSLVDCTPFKCEPSGICKPTCVTIDDCVAPNVCDLTGKCLPPGDVAQPAAQSSGCGCRVGGRPTGGSGLAAAGIVAMVLGRRRNRSSRRRSSESRLQVKG